MVDFSVQQVYMALNELKSARGLSDEQRQFWEDMKPVDVYALLYALERTIPEEDDAVVQESVYEGTGAGGGI